MTVEEFNAEAKKWLETARDPRWKRPYTELVYQPMLEVLRLLRANGFKTYIVTGGGQDFVRVYSERVYGIPPEQVVGTAGATKFAYAKDGKPFLTKEPKLLAQRQQCRQARRDSPDDRPPALRGLRQLDRRPGDAGMDALPATGARLKVLVLHDDATREYAYGPAAGLPDTKVGAFTPALYDEAKKNGWTVISMKNQSMRARRVRRWQTGLWLALAVSASFWGSFASAQEERGPSTSDLAKAGAEPHRRHDQRAIPEQLQLPRRTARRSFRTSSTSSRSFRSLSTGTGT